jgi:hypothetical protein
VNYSSEGTVRGVFASCTGQATKSPERVDRGKFEGSFKHPPFALGRLPDVVKPTFRRLNESLRLNTDESPAVQRQLRRTRIEWVHEEELITSGNYCKLAII